MPEYAWPTEEQQGVRVREGLFPFLQEQGNESRVVGVIPVDYEGTLFVF